MKKNYTLVAIFTIVIAASSFMAGHSIGYWNGYAEKINWVNQEEEMAREHFVNVMVEEAKDDGYEIENVEFLGGRLANGTGVIHVELYDNNKDVYMDVIYTGFDIHTESASDCFVEWYCADNLIRLEYDF